MKFNTKSIRFNTWLYFLAFSLLILTILGILLSVLIKPHYRNSQLIIIDNISSGIESRLINKSPSDKDAEEISKLVVSNNVCALIYNEDGQQVYNKNSLGDLCMLDQDVTIDNQSINVSRNPKEIIDLLKTKNINNTLISPYTGLEMLVYGKKISSELSNYYLILNTQLEPVGSYIDYFMNQYFFMGIGVIAIAIVVAYFLATKITTPIEKMKEEANKLADGNYNVSFEANSYTEINDLASTLDDATNKLSKINELRKDLVANVSHDIKTPLTVIQSYAEMIKDISGDDPIKRNEHLDVILKETEYLNKLVVDMQEYSKMQAGLAELNKDNFDLKETTEEVIDLLKTLIDSKQIILITSLSEATVYGDEMKLSQVIYNFLSNAIKHSHDNGTIEINIISDEDKVRLEVIDNGEGISEEALPYIWDRYYKIDKGFSRNSNSTGLGLAIAKAILEAHRAKYGVESKINEGSKFYFELSKDYDE